MTIPKATTLEQTIYERSPIEIEGWRYDDYGNAHLSYKDLKEWITQNRALVKAMLGDES